MLIRKAVKSDINQIEKIYNKIHTREESGEVTIGWERGVYPTRATAVEALSCGDLFVLEDSAGQVAAAARINQVQVPEYALGHNCPYLRMDTNERNTGTRKLYKKLGYTEEGILRNVLNIPSSIFRKIVYYVS